MNNVIQLIERIGSSSDLSAENYAEIVEQSEISLELKTALLNRDIMALEDLLGSNHNLMCILAPSDDDDGDADDDSGDDQQSESIAV